MKRILSASLLALGLLAASTPSASAWSGCKFSCGLCFEHMGGGNCFGWGLWKSQQPPPPDGFGFGGDLPMDDGLVGAPPVAFAPPAPLPVAAAPVPAPKTVAVPAPAPVKQALYSYPVSQYVPAVRP